MQYGRRLAAMKLWDPERATPEHMFCVAFLTTIIVAKEPKTQGLNSIDQLKFQHTFQRSFQQSFYSSVGHPVVLETLLKSLLKSLLRFQQSY